MISAIVNTYRERIIMKALGELPFQFTANLEVPGPMQLLSDIIGATPKPAMIVQPNDVAKSMALDNATSNMVAMDRTTLNRKLAADGLAWVPGGLVNKEILEIPDVQIITTDGSSSLADLPKDVTNRMLRLSRKERVTIFEEEMNNLILPCETADQLWGIPALWNVYAAYNGDGIKYTDKMKCAKILGKRVPYLKRCDVRTMRAEVVGRTNGLHLCFI